MKRALDIQPSAEGKHPLVAETRHQAHAVLTQPGLVEKAGWYVEQGASVVGNVALETTQALRALAEPLSSAIAEGVQGLGTVTERLATGAGTGLRSSGFAFRNFLTALFGKR